MEISVLIIKLPEDLKQLLKRRAEAEHRDMTKQVIFLIEQDLKESGMIAAPALPTPEQTKQ